MVRNFFVDIVCPNQRRCSHQKYTARRQRGEAMVDWDTWIRDDLALLKRAGVVQDWSKVDFEEFSGTDQEYNAWKTYLRNPSSQMLLGRGLYAIQLEQYFAAMDKAGKPRSDLLVIRSEELRSDTQQVYNQVLDFLNLPPHNLSDLSAVHETGRKAAELPDDLRRLLQDFFEPYNERLYKLLGWDKVWKYE